MKQEIKWDTQEDTISQRLSLCGIALYTVGKEPEKRL